MYVNNIWRFAMKPGRLVLAALPIALCLVLGSCFDVEDMTTLIKLNADGSAEMMLVVGGLTYENEGKPVSREEVLKETDRSCAEMRQESTEERKLVRCEAKLPADMLGTWFNVPADDGKVNGHYVLRYAKALGLFDEMAVRDQNRQPIQLAYQIDDSGLSLRVYSDRMTGSKSGLIAIQTPWPIVSSNADMRFNHANLAVWDSRKQISEGTGVMLELVSRKPGAK